MERLEYDLLFRGPPGLVPPPCIDSAASPVFGPGERPDREGRARGE